MNVTQQRRTVAGLCLECERPRVHGVLCGGHHQLYRQRHQARRAADVATRQPKACAHCSVLMGVDYKPKGGRPSTFCSDACGVAFRSAPRKAAAQVKRDQQRMASRQKADDHRLQLSLKTIERVCSVCGTGFKKPLFKPGLFTLCSIQCRQIARSAGTKRARQLHGSKPAERARRKGLPYERCGPIAVCIRDKWRCQLCGVSTPQRLRGTYDPRAPEVDHIIPLAHPDSPGHVWANVQCACRQCNIKKGARVLGQLRLAV